MAFVPDLLEVPTRKRDGTVLSLPNSALIGPGRVQVPDMLQVSTATGTRASVIKINSAVKGSRRVPQPFANALLSLFVGSDVQLDDGYIGHPYNLIWTFQSDPTMSFYGGGLPPGILFSQPTLTQFKLTGTPTTLGTYTFELKVVTADTFGFITFHITINPDPDQGVGSMVLG